MKKLDFLIIGAQKSGTTSLHMYLNTHPQIYMPIEKEAPFFSKDNIYQKGWDVYAMKYFLNVPKDKICGKATPHYMGDPRVPQRIYEMMPNIKLIAILRNPIERAFSHYKMSVRRGLEKRSFDEAVRELMNEDHLNYARSLLLEGIEPETNSYLVWGEYGRIIENYLNLFNREKLLIIFTEELEKQPLETIKKIFRFIEIEEDFIPPNLNVNYHVGIKHDYLYKLTNVSLLQLIWQNIPEKYRNNFRNIFKNLLDNFNLPSQEIKAEISLETKNCMLKFYREDVIKLNQLIKRNNLWNIL